jgi:hypothetical protein
MSPREELQQRLATWLNSWTTAPYGVLTDLRNRHDGPGKVRVLTFGLAGTLDATLFIWSPKRLELQSSRTTGTERFDSEESFMRYCETTFGAPAHITSLDANLDAVVTRT